MENEEDISAAPEADGETEEKIEVKPILNEHVLTKKQKTMRTLMQWVIISVGSLIMAVSVYFFQTPNNMTFGGVAGIAFLLEKLCLTQGIWMIIINFSLIVLGLAILGRQCTIRTIYASALYTGFIYLFEIIGKAANLKQPITGDNTTLALIYAILLFGVGGALIFNCGSSSGGTDIIALILKKYTRLNVAVSLFIVDFIVVCITIYTVNIETALLSVLGLFLKSFLLDGVIESLSRTKYITIITSMPDEIGKYILEVVNHSYTVYDARGGYTGAKKNVILTICKRSEAWKLKTKIKEIDPSAFVVISNANEILGKGFGGNI